MGICEVQNNGYIYEKSNEEATKIQIKTKKYVVIISL